MRTELLAVGILGSGSRLGDRVETLLRGSRATRGAAGLAGCLLVVTTLAAVFAPRWIAFAQASPSFEVASIKPGDPNPQLIDSNIQPGGRFLATNLTLKELVGNAYPDYRILGGPKWSESDRFTIEARADGAASLPPGKEGDEQVRLMLQSLLSERFKLSVHRETREEPIYELLVAKGGPKLKQAAAGSKGPRLAMPRGVLTATAVPLTFFAKGLSVVVRRSVIDKTGLGGTYDFSLTYSPQPSQDGSLRPQSDPDAPSIFTALQEQLGLKLESAKGLVETLVIDHAEKPNAN